MPVSVPVAFGRFGVRSPSRWGTRTSPPAPGAARQREVVEALVVDAEQRRDGVGHLGGVQRAHERQEPSGGVGEAGDGASGSADGVSLTVKAVPLVPRLSTRSPGRAPRPSAAAMLSPVPGPTTAPRHSPAGSSGRGRGAEPDQSGRRRRARGGRAGTAPRPATSSRCPRHRRGR